MKRLPSFHKVVVLYSKPVHLRPFSILYQFTILYKTEKKGWPEDAEQGETGSLPYKNMN